MQQAEQEPEVEVEVEAVLLTHGGCGLGCDVCGLGGSCYCSIQ